MSRNHDRLDPARWARVRRQVLERDGWRCRQCGRAGRLEVDHVVPIEDGGDAWDMENLQALCRVHHLQKTADENRRRRGPEDPRRTRWRELAARF